MTNLWNILVWSKKKKFSFCVLFFFKLGFTPCKAEKPIRGMELQEAQKRLEDTENQFRKNLQKDAC